MFLLDTNVLSEAAPNRGQGPNANVVAWLATHDAQLFLSAITIAEIADGVAKARREGASQKADDLDKWLDGLTNLFHDRILNVDVGTARLAGTLSDLARGQGRSPGLADIIIAATAKHNGLAVLTRNTKHFLDLGVDVIDPFLNLPDSPL